jgi:hypothetical protein
MAGFGCSVATDSAGDGETNDWGQVEEPIYNGTTVQSTGLGYPMVFTKTQPSGLGSLCSATILTNSWVLTAKHCNLAVNAADPSYTTHIVLDYGKQQQQDRAVTQIVLHPNWDIALVKVDSPFDMNGSPGFPNYYGYAKRMYPWPDLLNQTVTGWGYGDNAVAGGSGTGAGTFRSGTMRVSETGIFFNDEVASNNPGIALVANPNQLIFTGDSGGAVTFNALQGPNTLAAVTTAGNVNPDGSPKRGLAIPTAAISQWAITTMYPNRVFTCHGVECLTTQTQLANNTGYSTTWAPCGGFRTAWEAQISFENNYDYFYINGRAMTGTGTFSGTESQGALQLQISTDYSVLSPGVKWLRIRCVQ